MHFCTFVIIGDTAASDSAVAMALAPFDESLEVPPYRDYVDAAELGRMSAHYCIPATDLSALASRIEDWRSRPGGVDSRGLYAITTLNPSGRWDWYQIGGRWDGFIPGSRRNVIRVATLLKDDRLCRCLPYQIVTPDGRWLEDENASWFTPPTDADREREARWYARVRDVLASYPGHRVVCVDVHS
jgi:hypothetical protein